MSGHRSQLFVQHSYYKYQIQHSHINDACLSHNADTEGETKCFLGVFCHSQGEPVEEEMAQDHESDLDIDTTPCGDGNYFTDEFIFVDRFGEEVSKSSNTMA